jgi:AcrR family transcriptional regulator
MLNAAGDPRTERTVTRLRSALRESLAHTQLDDLSVSTLCARAEIGRTSFYTHYSSIGELLTEMLTSEIDELLDVPDTTGMPIDRVANEFQDTLVQAFEVVGRDRSLFRVGLESNTSALLRRSILGLMTHRLGIALDVWRSRDRARDIDVQVAVAFAAGGLAASLEAWVHSDETDADRFAAAVRDQMAPWWPRPTEAA